jgi:hypothetical protein
MKKSNESRFVFLSYTSYDGKYHRVSLTDRPTIIAINKVDLLQSNMTRNSTEIPKKKMISLKSRILRRRMTGTDYAENGPKTIDELTEIWRSRLPNAGYHNLVCALRNTNANLNQSDANSDRTDICNHIHWN